MQPPICPQLFNHQKGQVLPVGIAFIMFSALLVLVMFNTGKLATERSRITNAADSAAYSGLVWQARALNFQAYSNRAMVANQVAIAQIVSMASWTEYGQVATENIDDAIGWIPFVGAYTSAAESALEMVNEIVLTVGEIAIPVIDVVNQSLSAAQTLMYVSAFTATPHIVEEIVEANSGDYQVDSTYNIAMAADNLNQWRRFTNQYDDNDGLQRKADVIRRSQSSFVNDRGWSLGRFYVGPLERHTIIKEGETRLIYSEDDDEWAWRGKDSLSIHVERYKCKFRCRWKSDELPIGWGDAYTTEKLDQCVEVERTFMGDTEFTWTETQCPDWTRKNNDAEEQGESVAEQISSNYTGVQAYYDLSDLSADNRDPRLTLKVEVRLPQNKLRTSSKLEGVGSKNPTTQKTEQEGLGEGAFWLNDAMADNSMTAIGSGEIYFRRPVERAGNLWFEGEEKTEYASLFNPYWNVRLKKLSDNQRLTAWGMRSSELVSSTASGAVNAASSYVGQQNTELRELQGLSQYNADQLNTIDQVIALEQTELNNQLASIDGQINALNESIAQTDAADDALLDQQTQQLNELTESRERVDASLATAPERIRDRINSQIDRLPNDIEQIRNTLSATLSGDLPSITSDTNDIADRVERIGTQDNYLASERGQRDSQNTIDDLLADNPINSVNSGLQTASSEILGVYDGDIQQHLASIEYGELPPNQVQSMINEARTHIDEATERFNANESRIQNEYNNSMATISQTRDRVNSARSQAIDQVRSAAQTQVAALEQSLQSAANANEASRYQTQINDVQAESVTEIDAINVQYDQQITVLDNQQSELTEQVNTVLGELNSDFVQDTEFFEAQLDHLQSLAK